MIDNSTNKVVIAIFRVALVTEDIIVVSKIEIEESIAYELLVS